MNKIITDNNLQEIFEYPKSYFSLFVWKDDYENFVNRTAGTHWHGDFEYGLLLSGELDYYMSDYHIHMKKGDCVFVNSNTLHMATQKTEEKAVMLGVTFKPAIFGADNDSVLYKKYFQNIADSRIQGFQINTETECGKRIAEDIKQINNISLNDEGYELLCLSIISKIWYNTILYWKNEYDNFVPIVTNQKYENDVKQIIYYIKKHYMENILIEDIIKYTGISRSECFRCFKLFTSKTPIEYIVEYRLTSAANLLKSTNDTVLEICNKCGFSNSSYFGKKFKEQYGVTPLAYRKKYK